MLLGFLVCPLLAMIAALAIAVLYPGEVRDWLLPAVRLVAGVTVTVVLLALLVELSR